MSKLLLFAAALVMPAGDAAGQQVPESVRKAFARELPPLPQRQFEFKREGKSLTWRVEAKGEVAVRGGEDPVLLEIPLGTEDGIACSVHQGRIDAASSIVGIVGGLPQSLKVVSVRTVEVAAVAGSPAVFVEVVYLAGPDGEKLAGQLKQAVVVHPQNSLLCVHDEPGYGETFLRVVKGLAANLMSNGADARSSARYAEVARVSVEGQLVGFLERLLVPGEAGSASLESFLSMLLPRSPTEIVAREAVVVERMDAAGRILSVVHHEGSNGELEMSLNLSREADGKTYRYTGEVKSKKLEGKFTTRSGLVNDAAVAQRVRALLSGASKEERAQEYAASVDASHPVDVIYRKAAGERRIAVELGGRSGGGTADEHGWFSRIDLQKNFVSGLMDAIDRGIGQLVDADMNEESTRLQALQVQAQLGIQALSIANQSSQNVLSLFR